MPAAQASRHDAFQQRLHVWAGLLVALFFLTWAGVLWHTARAPRLPPADPAPASLRPARVQHPPAPQTGRDPLPRSVLLMTLSCPQACRTQRLLVLLPERHAGHPALTPGSDVQITLDEHGHPPRVQHILDPHGQPLVPAAELHAAALVAHEKQLGTARILLCFGLAALAFATTAGWRLYRLRPDSPRAANSA